MRTLRLMSPALKACGLVLIAFLFVGVTFQLTGYSFGSTISGIWQGAVSGPGALQASIRWSIPLFITALGVLVVFRAGLFNIGAQGQFYAGAITGITLPLTFSNAPRLILIPAAVLAGVLGGAIWSLIPGVLRMFFDTDEILTTLMMNSIALLLVDFITNGPLKDPAGNGNVSATQTVSSGFRLSNDQGVSSSLLGIVAAVSIGTYFLLHRTHFGFESDMTGRNLAMSRLQGIATRRVGLVAFAISGALAGLAGILEILGPSGRATTAFSPNVGFTAILVALIAGRSVVGALCAAAFFGGLQSASLFLPILTGMPTSALEVLNGMVTFIITASTVPVIAWRFRLRSRRDRISAVARSREASI